MKFRKTNELKKTNSEKTYYLKSTTPTVFMNQTLYSGPQADIVNASLSFKACGKTNCGDWVPCTVTF